jgi:hypothetical protein
MCNTSSISPNLSSKNYSMKIYPNPANDILYLEDVNFEVKKVEVYNLQGQPIIQTDFNDNSKPHSISISLLKPGVYYIKSYTNEGLTGFRYFTKL